eukprot:1195161-Prorocentrum_minimum.AAC.3
MAQEDPGMLIGMLIGLRYWHRRTRKTKSHLGAEFAECGAEVVEAAVRARRQLQHLARRQPPLGEGGQRRRQGGAREGGVLLLAGGALARLLLPLRLPHQHRVRGVLHRHVPQQGRQLALRRRRHRPKLRAAPTYQITNHK